MKAGLHRLLAPVHRQQSGLALLILLLGIALTMFAGSHPDPATDAPVNNFLNSYTLMQTATNASFFAIMAVGATMVIAAGKIDLSVGSIYALSGVAMAMTLRALAPGTGASVVVGIVVCLGVGTLCGLLNGVMSVGLGVHPFIITLGTMWALRGLAFVISHAESILVPDALTDVAKATLGLPPGLYPVPLATMLATTALGFVVLSRTTMGRHIYAIGGNVEASRYSGLAINRLVISVYAISGLTAGVAAFIGCAYYGSAASADATGYELYVIASAVVGGASLSGGKGGAVSAALGTLLIVLIRQSIVTLRLDQNYEWIIIGCAIVTAVAIDQFNARLAARRMARERSQ
ncbi:MAG TPA: ABC transporter permease [Terriglobia bacterium]|nr:ABC transporter permease [Terriglobia bacterium]